MGNGFESMRTQLTESRLRTGVQVLYKMISACNTCRLDHVSWNHACRENHLDPLKARRMVLALDRLMDCDVTIEESTEKDLYDGYEQFYRVIFGDQSLKRVSLPYDYQESVMHVIKHTSLDGREQVILMRHFGIGDYNVPESFAEIDRDFDVVKSRIIQIADKALEKCRHVNSIDILRMGLTRYEQGRKQAKELQRQQLRQTKEEHEAFMAKQKEEHEKRMQIISTGSYEEALKALLPSDLIDRLFHTDIHALDLSVRAYNALKFSGLNNVLDVLALSGVDDCLKIRHMGVRSAEEVVSKLDGYAKENYGVTAEALRAVCFQKNNA